MDEITDGQTFLYVVLPQFYSYKNENYEFVMILVDYKKLDLKNGYTYWGSARKEAFVADAKKELHPLFDQER